MWFWVLSGDFSFKVDTYISEGCEKKKEIVHTKKPTRKDARVKWAEFPHDPGAGILIAAVMIHW